MMRFCVDIDNVVAATDRVMRKAIFDFTSGRVDLAYEDILDFDYWKCRDRNGNRISEDEWSTIHKVFSSPRYLWAIEPVPGAIDGLKALSDFGRLHLVTSRLACGRRPTVEWLEFYDVPPHSLYFVSHREKHASFHPFDVAIEDDYTQALAFATQSAASCILLSHPWNSHKDPHPRIERVLGWRDVIAFVSNGGDRALLGP